MHSILLIGMNANFNTNPHLSIFDARADCPCCTGLHFRVLVFEKWPQQPHTIQSVNDSVENTILLKTVEAQLYPTPDPQSICSSVHVSNCVRSISPEPLNHFFFLPNLAWWCIIMRQCVIRKNWFTIFNVEVTARAYNQNMIFLIFFTTSSKLLVCLQPNWVW